MDAQPGQLVDRLRLLADANMHIQLVHRRAILATLFDHRTSVGLVRLHAKALAADLSAVLEAFLVELSDLDIDGLFDD